MGKNEIIEVLRVIVTGELPYLQEKVDYLRNHVSRLEHEQKKKQYHLSVLDKRINDLAYNEYSKYHPPISNDNSPKPLPYKEDGIIYSNSDTFDKSIRNSRYALNWQYPPSWMITTKNLTTIYHVSLHKTH